MHASHRKFYVSMAIFWLLFGLGTTLYPRMMQMFMTAEGVSAAPAPGHAPSATRVCCCN